MSHQFDLFPPPPPREQRGLRTLSLYNPWTHMLVLYKLDELGLRAFRILGPVEPCKASKRRWSASELRLHNEPDKTKGERR